MELLISAQSYENGVLNSARCNLAGVVTLGRGPESPLLLDGTGISREHFQLHIEGGALFITDLSSNGTWLNARRLTRLKPQPLTSIDEIRIPGFKIRIDWQDSSTTGVPSSPKPAVVPPEPVVGPVSASRPLAFVRNFGASFSRVEKLLFALALATLAVVVLYLMSP